MDVAKSVAADPSSDPFLSRKVGSHFGPSGGRDVNSLAWSTNLDMKVGRGAAFPSSSSDTDMLSELVSEPAATEKDVGQAEEDPAQANVDFRQRLLTAPHWGGCRHSQSAHRRVLKTEGTRW